MSSSSHHDSAPQPVPDENVAEVPLPWSWKCEKLVRFFSNPHIAPSTSWWESCDNLNEGVDVCTRCNTYIKRAGYQVVHQTAPPPPPPLTQQRMSRRGPTPRN